MMSFTACQNVFFNSVARQRPPDRGAAPPSWECHRGCHDFVLKADHPRARLMWLHVDCAFKGADHAVELCKSLQ